LIHARSEFFIMPLLLKRFKVKARNLLSKNFYCATRRTVFNRIFIGACP